MDKNENNIDPSDSLETDYGQVSSISPVQDSPEPSDVIVSNSQPSLLRFNRPTLIITGLAALALAVVILGVAWLSGLLGSHKADLSQVSNYNNQSVQASGVKGYSDLISSASNLKINGNLQIVGSLALSPSSTPASPSTGQLYYNQAANAPYYYNGSTFVSLAPLQVTSVDGVEGDIALGQGLVISGNQLGLSATTLQALHTIPAPTISLQSASSNLTITSNTQGLYSLSDSSLVGAGIAGQIAVFTASGNLGSSALSQNAQGLTAASNFTTSGLLTVGTLGSNSNSSYLCYNSLNQLSSCGVATTGNYIDDQALTAQSANFYIQSSSASEVGGVIAGAISQTADLEEYQDFNGDVLSGFTHSGALQGGNAVAGNTDIAGTNLNINGGEGTGAGSGGNIDFNIYQSGASGSNNNTTSSKVLSLSGSNGAATFQNSSNSTAALQIQDTSSNPVLDVDTMDSTTNLYAGSNYLDTPSLQIFDPSSTNASLQVLTNANNQDIILSTGINSSDSGGGNTALGAYSLQEDNGDNNTAVGVDALQTNVDGSFNTAIGYGTMQYSNNAVDDVAIGLNSLQNDIAGSNVAVGANSLQANTSGQNNAALGLNSLESNLTGNNNTAFGVAALEDNTTGTDDSATGFGTLQNNTTGSNNIAVGDYSLNANTTGNNSTAIGFGALSDAVSSNNTAIGSNSLGNDTTGSDNTAIGLNSLQNANTNNDTAIGESALQSDNGGNNTAIGLGALQSNTTGDNNTAIGVAALQNANTNQDVAIGQAALRNDTGGQNIAIGQSALQTNTSGNQDIAIGLNALEGNTGGGQNIAIGESSLEDNTTGNWNNAFGLNTLQNNTTGYNNEAFGSYTLQANTTGYDDTSFGDDSQVNTTTGNFNTDLGGNTLQNNTTGSGNLALGGNSGNTNNTGNNNSLIGYQSDVSIDGLQNATAIGTYSVVGESDALVLGCINGVNGCSQTTDVGIGTSTPGATLNVVGNDIFQAQTDSTTEFQVQAVNATPVLNVDTTDGRVDIGNQGTPTGQLYIGGSIPTSATSSTNINNVNQFTISGNYAYGCSGDNGGTVYVYNVSNVNNPVQIGSANINTGCSNISAQGNYIYIGGTTGSGDATLSVVNVSDPSNPTIATAYSIPGYSEVIGIRAVGKYLYLTSDNSLHVLDITNPATPVDVSNVALGSANGLNIGPQQNISVHGNYAYVAENDANELQIVNIANPLDPVVASTITGLNAPTSVAVNGRYAYITNSGDNTLSIYDVSDPDSPSSVGSIGTGSSSTPFSVAVAGNYAYVADSGDNEITVYDVSDPGNPALAGTIQNVPQTPNNIIISGNYAYVNGWGSNTFDIYDLGGTYSESLQVGSTETSSLQVDNNSVISGDESISGSDSIGQDLQVSGNFGVGGSGLFEDNTNSTTAFRVQNATADTIFNVDTSNDQISVNNSDGTSGVVIRAGGSGLFNNFVGTNAGSINTTGSQNEAIGQNALQDNATGSQNEAIGESALQNNTTGNLNAAIGNNALVANTTGNLNIAIGNDSLENNTTGSDNTAVGLGTLQSETTIQFDTAVGGDALQATTTGSQDVAIGSNSSLTNIAGNDDTSLGVGSLKNSTAGSNNTAVGWRSLFNLGSGGGSQDTGLGEQSEVQDGDSNSTAIGIDSEVNESNALALGCVSGVNGCSQTTDIGIGTNSPANLLSIGAITAYGDNTSAQIAVSTNGSGNSGIVVQNVSGQNAGDAFLLQKSDDTPLASIDYQGNLSVKNATINGTLTINGNIITGSAATSSPTAQSSAGASASCSISGNQTTGTITVNTGSGPTQGDWCTFTINYTGTPRPVISGINQSSSALLPYANATGSTLTVGVSGGTPASGIYKFNYFMAQ